MWILLTTTRRTCWLTWLTATGVVVLLTFLQTVAGKFEETVGLVWLWTFVNLLPGLVLLFISLLTNKYPGALLPKATHLALLVGTSVYLAMVFLTLLAEPFATAENLSLGNYRTQSFFWLAPFQLLLSWGYFITFYKQKGFAPPDESIIQQTAQRSAEKWDRKENALKHLCFELIADGEVGGAINKFREQAALTSTVNLNDVVLLQNQYISVRRDIDLNMVGYGEGQRQINRITMALMNMIEQNT